jgi:di/tricarboxylate transporter
MIVAATCGIPMLECALVAVSVMILFKIINPTEALQCIEWPLLILIGSSFGIGKAITNSGVSSLFASLVTVVHLPHWLLPGIINFLTAIASCVIGNNASAALFVPMSVQLARQIGINPRPLCMAVAIGASACFSTPIGYQTNLMVQGPGGYTFFDRSRCINTSIFPYQLMIVIIVNKHVSTNLLYHIVTLLKMIFHMIKLEQVSIIKIF